MPEERVQFRRSMCKNTFFCVSWINLIYLIFPPGVPSVTMHGLRAEDGVHERPAGAQPDPTWRHLPEGGAGGEQEDLSEKSSTVGGSGWVTAGGSQFGLNNETNQVWKSLVILPHMINRERKINHSHICRDFSQDCSL